MDGPTGHDPEVRRAQLLGMRPQSDIVVAAQRIIDLHGDRVIAYDMLSRFPRTTATPVEVFAEARELGVIVPFELLAARCALEGLSVVPPAIALAIRVSPETLVDDQLASLLRWSQPEQVIVQISALESVQECPEVLRAVQDLRALGVRLAVTEVRPDDCRRPELLLLDPHLVKLHGAIVNEVDHDETARDAVSTVVKWASTTNAEVVAVHVERGSQIEPLFDLGVHHVQGFHLGRPADFIGPDHDDEDSSTTQSTGSSHGPPDV